MAAPSALCGEAAGTAPPPPPLPLPLPLRGGTASEEMVGGVRVVASLWGSDWWLDQPDAVWAECGGGDGVRRCLGAAAARTAFGRDDGGGSGSGRSWRCGVDGLESP